MSVAAVCRIGASGRRWVVAIMFNNIPALIRLVTGLLLCGLLIPQVHGQEPPVAPLDPLKAAEQLNARRQALEKEKTATEQLRKQISVMQQEWPARLEALPTEKLTEAMVEKARIEVQGAQLAQQDLTVRIDAVPRRIKELEGDIAARQKREQLLMIPPKDETDSKDRTAQLDLIRRDIEQKQAELELEKQNLDNLRAQVEPFSQLTALREQWLSRLEELYRFQEDQARREAQEDLAQRLRQEMQAHAERAAQLRRRLEQERDALTDTGRRLLETRIGIAEGRGKMTETTIRLSAIANDLQSLQALADNAAASADALQKGLAQVRILKNELGELASLTQRTRELSAQVKEVLAKQEGLTDEQSRAAAEEGRFVDEMLERVPGFQDKIREMQSQADALETRLNAHLRTALKRDLLAPQPLPRTPDEWRQLLTQAGEAYRSLFYQIGLSIEATFKALRDMTVLQWLWLTALEGGLLALLIWARRRAVSFAASLEERGAESFIGNVALAVLDLFSKNRLSIGIAAALLLALWVIDAPPLSKTILMTLVMLWLSVKIPINLAWVLLSSPRLPPARRQRPLYQRLFWTLLPGGLMAAVVMVGRLIELPAPVSNVFDRLFMLFWFLVLWAVLPVRRLVIQRLGERYAERYWFFSLRLASLLLPLCLLAAALLGLAGYLNLAWLVAWHLLVFIGVLVGWLAFRGLLNDLAILLKNLAVRHSEYALLWTQDVISPLQRILNMLLYVAGWVALFWVYGWGPESAVVNEAWRILERPLFTLGGATISLWGILVTTVDLLLVIWFGEWARAIAYRWVFSRIVDLGIRNSLSAFTQYIIVLIGVLITLNIIGLDLTSLAVFAGALGVGIGLGMQDVAKNFVGGILLLIERPLRTGDIVKIGDNEGEVTRIGMRAMTMKTWDNMVVIIPNSDVISNAFTNWTHHDKILRTVLIIGVSYDADPHQVKVILERVLNANKAVLREPAPSVFFWEFGQSSVDFRVQYFVDTDKDSQLETRSRLRFAIWDAFKQEGIGIPYPQRDVHIKELPSSIGVEGRGASALVSLTSAHPGTLKAD